MDRKQLQQSIREQGEGVARRRQQDAERAAHRERVNAAAREINGRASDVVAGFKDLVMLVAPDEVVTRPDQYDYHAQKTYKEAIKKPATVEINLGAHTDPDLGAGTAKATVSLIGAPARDEGITPYSHPQHVLGVRIDFDFIGDGPNPNQVALGDESFNVQQVMGKVYKDEYRSVDETALPGVMAEVEAMEGTAARTLEYLTECIRDAELNPELAARIEARRPLQPAAPEAV